MTYADFKENFLPEFLKIKSFKGKMDYANQYLQRIGRGTGRVVYDIDGEKVLKLAKNSKGIAQNEAEANAGYYRDTQDIVAIIFDSADDDSWLIVEKAKKVNEARIKQLTDIPSLRELFYFLRNYEEQNKGRNKIFGQDPDVEKFLWENEFAYALADFVANYSQKAGDMGRPSTYGEVLRDGQPAIVLTDYGLNDEVYDTHYSPNRKQKYRMYELYNFADGNDDILSDMPPQDGIDTRNAMWGLMPYSVSDGEGVVNEDFISFILNRDKYPTRPLPSAPYLVDKFHECVNNLKENLNHVKDKKKFYNNLLELQDYLIRGKFYDREPLEKMVVNESENLKEYVERDLADSIATQVAQQYNYETPKYLGEGGFGVAYDIGDNMVLKVTSDRSEANENLMLVDKPLKHIAEPYKVFAIKPQSDETKQIYVIILEKLKTDTATFKAMTDRMEFAFKKIMGVDYADVLDHYINNRFADDNVDEEKVKKYLAKNSQDAKFFNSVLKIGEEVKKYGIQSIDYVEPSNLGYKPDGTLAFFDVGFGNYFFNADNPPEEIELAEDATSKFSSVDSIGRDNFPAHNNNDESPVTDNNIPTTIVDEDLEYHHVVGDATDDEYELDERIKTYMPGSKSVEVKKKCRLGGLGGTSAACNQGDINNLNLKSIDEAVIPFNNNFWGWVSPDNRFIQVSTLKHMQYLEKIYPEISYDYDGLADKAFEDGWVRISYEKFPNFRTSLNINGQTKQRVLDVFKSMFYDFVKYGNNTIYLEWVEPHGYVTFSTGDSEGKEKLVNYISEEIDASETHSNEGSIKTVIGGKRDVGFVEINKTIYQTLEKYHIGVIPVRMITAYLMKAIIYSADAKDKAFRLYNIVKKNGGYLKDKSAEEAREIGQLLGYKEASIEEYIRRHYGNKIPTVPEKSPDDFDDLQEQIFPDIEKQLNKDIVTHNLNKVLIRTYKDADDTVDVYAVNGDKVRDSGFIEWVDGGNHWVDADLPENEQKYAKHIGADIIWIDDALTQKPIDFEGTLLHERTESYIIKHFGYEYDDAHEIANKIELAFRKKAVDENITTDEDAERLASLMYVAFKKHFKGNKAHHNFMQRSDEHLVHENINQEGVADKYAEKAFNIQDPNTVGNVQAMGDIQKSVEQPIAYVVGKDSNQLKFKVPIYKNPKSLTNFENHVRAIVDTDGNLYVVQQNGWFNHGDMGFALRFSHTNQGIYDDEDNFQLLHRIEKTNGFGLGDSTVNYYNRNYNNFENTKAILREAKRKNPQYDFYAEHYTHVQGEPVSLNELFAYPELTPEKKDTWNINGEEVGISFFMEKYDEWNNQGGEDSGYKDPSEASVFEFLQNNYEDFIHDEKLKKELLWALTDREVLDEKNKFTESTR